MLVTYENSLPMIPYDGNGREIEYCLWVDTLSGICCVYTLGQNGRPVIRKDSLHRHLETRPLPIRFELVPLVSGANI